MNVNGGNVVSSLQLVTAPFDRALARAAGDLNRFTSRLSAPLRLPAGGLLAIAGGVGLGAGLGQIAKQAADMESSMARLNRVAALPRAQFEKLGKEVRQLAGDMAGVSEETIFRIAAFGAKMGVAGEKLGMFTRDIAKLSIAVDDMDPERAAQGIARIASVFNVGTEQAGRFTAALVALDNASTASASDILNITNRMSGMASVLGISPQKTMALAAATREAGVNPETAGTSLSQVLGKMGDKTTHGGFGKIAGMSGKDFGGLVKSDALGALQAVAKGLKGMDAEKAIASLNRLHLQGQRTRQTLLGLAQTGGTLGRFTGIASREWDTMASLERNVGIESGTLNAQWTRLHNNFKLTAAELGKALLPILKALADGLVHLMADIRDSVERNQETFVAWGKKIGQVAQTVGVVWTHAGLFFDYFRIVMEEKLEQAGVVGGRFWDRLQDNAIWGVKGLARVVVNGLTGLHAVLADMMTRMGSNLGVQWGAATRNSLVDSFPGIAKQMGITKMAVPAGGMPAADWSKMGNLGAGVGAAPGFGGMFAARGMPNRDADKAAAWGKIGDATKAKAAANAARTAKQAADDARARVGPFKVPKMQLGGLAPKQSKAAAAREAKIRAARTRAAAARDARMRRTKGFKRLQKSMPSLGAGAGKVLGAFGAIGTKSPSAKNRGGFTQEHWDDLARQFGAKATEESIGPRPSGGGGGLFAAGIAGAGAVGRALQGQPGGRNLIKPDLDAAGEGGEPQAMLKKTDEMVGTLKSLLSEFQGMRQKGIPLLA